MSIFRNMENILDIHPFASRKIVKTKSRPCSLKTIDGSRKGNGFCKKVKKIFVFLFVFEYSIDEIVWSFLLFAV